MQIKKIFIAGDHAAFEAKEISKKILENLGFEPIDLGANSPEISVDYPDFAKALCDEVSKDEGNFGILICGTGLGISMAANRNPQIRCALCHDCFTATMSREHNDANVLAFGARVVGAGVIEDMIKAFFSTEFAGGRHERRVNKLGSCLC